MCLCIRLCMYVPICVCMFECACMCTCVSYKHTGITLAARDRGPLGFLGGGDLVAEGGGGGMAASSSVAFVVFVAFSISSYNIKCTSNIINVHQHSYLILILQFFNFLVQ